MTKTLPIPPKEETVTIPKSSFDNIFHTLEEMRDEIAALRKRLEGTEQKEENVLNSIQAAKFCGVSRQTIYAWRREKRIKKVERGGKRGYLESELLKVKEI